MLTLKGHYRAPKRNLLFFKPQVLTSTEILLSESRKQAKDSLWRLRSGMGTVIHPPSKKEGLRNIGPSECIIKTCFNYLKSLLWKSSYIAAILHHDLHMVWYLDSSICRESTDINFIVYI